MAFLDDCACSMPLFESFLSCGPSCGDPTDERSLSGAEWAAKQNRVKDAERREVRALLHESTLYTGATPSKRQLDCAKRDFGATLKLTKDMSGFAGFLADRPEKGMMTLQMKRSGARAIWVMTRDDLPELIGLKRYPKPGMHEFHMPLEDTTEIAPVKRHLAIFAMYRDGTWLSNVSYLHQPDPARTDAFL